MCKVGSIIGCDLCAGSPDCPCVLAYQRIYGDAEVHAARGDLDVWFPRAAPVVAASERTSAAAVLPLLAGAHDRLAAGGLERIRQREEAQKAQRGRVPVWLRRGGA